jgi:predicted AlkP superfamily pyrophosphatase or phosphodiesterase
MTLLRTLALVLVFYLPNAALAAERHVAILSVDGLGAAELARDTCLPADATIRKLAKAGAWSSGVTGILPTVTYPTHATIVTGAQPLTHGVIDNGARGVFWMKERADIRADTLWDAAKRAGQSVAIVTWPSSYGAAVDWRVPEDLAPRTNPTEDMRKGSTPGLFDALSEAAGKPELLHFGHPDSGTPLDRMTATFAAEIVRRHKPRLLLAHFLDFDHRMHAAPWSSAACESLARTDAWIAHLVAAYEAAGLRERTTFFIVSDHGFLKVGKAINVLALLRQAGWDEFSPDETPDKALDIKVTGGAVAFYALEPRSTEWTAKLGSQLRPRIEAAHAERLRWVTPAEAQSFGGFPGAAFVFCARPGYSLRTLGSSSDLLVDPGRFVGAHGYCPDEPAMDALFVASGHGVRAAGDIGRMRMQDLGPTMAAMLGVSLRDATGTDQSGRFRSTPASRKPAP